MQTVKHLKNTAEVFGRGGSHITTNPHKEQLIDKDLVYKINYELIPAQLDTVWGILTKPERLSKLEEIN